MSTPFSSLATIPSTADAIYTYSGSTVNVVKSVLIHNTNTTVETVKLYYVKNSSGSKGTAGTTNIIFNRSIAANETYLFTLDAALVLNQTNDTIQAVTTTASKVNAITLGSIA